MLFRAVIAGLLASLALSGSALALPLAQDWGDVGLIAADDDWTGVPSIVGRRGDGLVGGTGVDPQLVVADGSGTPVDVVANQTSPGTLATGGVAELELEDPAVALQPSGTADAPHLVVGFDSRGFTAITVSYRLRDLDDSDDDAVQPVALQYRVGASGEYTNVPAAFVADATTGPGLADLVTPVGVALPASAAAQPAVEFRVLTTNAEGSDEWVGVDDLEIAGKPVDTTAPALTLAARTPRFLPRALRRGIRARVTLDERAGVRLALRLRARLARRLGLPRTVGRARVAAGPGTTRAVVRFGRRAQRRLLPLPRFTVVVRARATDAAGNVATASARAVLRR
jgi:hypothetical protein